MCLAAAHSCPAWMVAKTRVWLCSSNSLGLTQVWPLLTSLGWRGPYGEGVGLCVEDVLVQAQQFRVVGEEQIQIFQRLAQEETLHLVPGPGVNGVTDIVDGCVATFGNLQTRYLVRGLMKQKKAVQSFRSCQLYYRKHTHMALLPTMSVNLTVIFLSLLWHVEPFLLSS